MAFDELMGLTNRLLAHAVALAAVAARLRLDELGEQGDPALREQLDGVLRRRRRGRPDLEPASALRRRHTRLASGLL